MPITQEGRSYGLFETADRIVPGGIGRFLLNAREAGKSYREIAEDLNKLNIVVSHETVRTWEVRIKSETNGGPWG